MPDFESFRERLRERRKQLNLTQSELGELCGVSAQEISHFETGRRMPELEMFVKLCNVLHTTPNALLWDYFDKMDIPYDASKRDHIRQHVHTMVKELTVLEGYFKY